MGVVKNVSDTQASQLLNSSGVDLLLSDLVNNKIGGWLFFFSLSVLPNVLIFFDLQVVILSPN